MNLQEIRQQYPQYDNVSDEQLARGLHKKYYPDMAYNDFADRIGYKKSYDKVVGDALAKEMIEEGRTEPNWKDKGKAALYGLGKAGGDVAKLGSSWLNGRTLGLSNLVGDKIAEATGNESLSPSKWQQDVIDEYGRVGRGLSDTLNFLGASNTIRNAGESLASRGLLGNGESGVSKFAKNVLLEKPSEAVASSVGSGVALGYFNPQTWYGNLATGVLGGMAGGIANQGIKAAKNTIKTPKQSSVSVPKTSEKNIVDAMSDADNVRRMRNAVQAGEKGVQQQADDILERMIARENGAVDDALNSALQTKEMKSAAESYSKFMVENGSNKLSKDAVKTFYKENPIARGLIDQAREIDPKRFQNVTKDSLKEFDILKQILRKMKGNQAEKTLQQSAAETAENAVKSMMDNTSKGFRDVNRQYAAAELAQKLFEKKVQKGLKSVAGASNSPFWSGLMTPLTSAGAIGGFINPISWATTAGALGGKAGLRALRRQAGRAIMSGRTPVYDSILSASANGLKNLGTSSIKYGKVPALSEILKEATKGE